MTFDISTFKATFPVFADSEIYPDTAINLAGTEATYHIRDGVCGMPMADENVRKYALNLMAAHILVLNVFTDKTTAKGEPTSGGNTFKSTIGSVAVENSKQNSFSIDDYSYWLGQTEYGRRLLALLESQAQFVFLNTPRSSVRVLV